MIPNPFLHFALQLFPDGNGTWTVKEIYHLAVYNYKDDGLTLTPKQFYSAVGRLLQRSKDYPKDEPFVQLAVGEASYRYPAASCRAILREVVAGKIPKNFPVGGKVGGVPVIVGTPLGEKENSGKNDATDVATQQRGESQSANTGLVTLAYELRIWPEIIVGLFGGLTLAALIWVCVRREVEP